MDRTVATLQLGDPSVDAFPKHESAPMATKPKSKRAISPSIDDTLTVGGGGEPHLIAKEGQDRLTTNHGMTVGDDKNSLKAGRRGPTLLEDFVLREKISHFDHERIPESVVHARGVGAHGFFELTDSLADLTTASILGEVGTKTEVFTRFSTVVAL